jgi:hypothetical protein
MNIIESIINAFSPAPVVDVATYLKQAEDYIGIMADWRPINTWPDWPSNVLLEQGEVVIFSASSTLYETRAVRYHTGGFAGFRVAKGVYVGGSRGRSLSEQEWHAVNDGQMTVTTRRVVFDGTQQDRQVWLDDLIAVDWTPNGVALTVDGRQKSMVLDCGNPLVAAALIIAAFQDKANWNTPGPKNPTKIELLRNAVAALAGVEIAPPPATPEPDLQTILANDHRAIAVHSARLWLMVLFFNMLVCACSGSVGWMLFWALVFSSCAYEHGYEHGKTSDGDGYL